jgi:uncharacterized protein
MKGISDKKRNLKLVKVTGFIFAIMFILYLLILVFAPNQLQRMGSFIRSKIGAGTPRIITFATAEKGGHYNRLGELLKKEMKKLKGQKVKVLVTGGTLENIQMVRKNEADFAFIQGALKEGQQAEFNGLSAVATIGWQYVHIVTPKDSTINRFKDLMGKTVSLGPKQSGNAALGQLVLDYFSPSAEVQTIYSTVEDIKKDFQAGKMSAIFLAYDLHAPVMESLLSEGGFRLVPIPEAEAISYRIPGCFAARLPHSLYGPFRDIPAMEAGEFPTLKVKTLLITRKTMNRFVVQNLLQTLYSTRFIKQSRLPELNEQKGRVVFDLPLHAAADRFYRRNDPVTADKYEIGSAFLASLLFIASIVGFFNNRRRARSLNRKKKNIIPYFEELLNYSQRMAVIENSGQLKELLDQMMAMQRKAEKQWLEGDLDTEHMENLYAIYGIRCDNAFNKMTLLEMVKQYELLNSTIIALNEQSNQEEQKGQEEESTE